MMLLCLLVALLERPLEFVVVSLSINRSFTRSTFVGMVEL